jgi:hypothetical protein
VEGHFTVKSESQYFDIVDTARPMDYGEAPLSLDTYLEIFQDPRMHKFVFTLKPGCSLTMTDLAQAGIVGRLVIKTNFRENPFRLPIRAET